MQGGIGDPGAAGQQVTFKLSTGKVQTFVVLSYEKINIGLLEA